METKDKSLNAVIIEYAKILESVGVEDARNNVLMLAEFVLGCNRGKLIALSNDEFDNVFTHEQKVEFEALIARRKSKEPLQYIIGETEFMGLAFKVAPQVLIPRQDTEVLVEKTLEHIEECVQSGLVKDCINILDMCTGSGCIAISLAVFLKEKFGMRIKIEITGVDISKGALEVAQENVVRNEVDDIVTLVHSDLFANLPEDKLFDVIVSNPPYIPSEDCKTLQDEVMLEPILALDGGTTGFDFYKRLIDDGTGKLTTNGVMLFEFGITQEKTLERMAGECFSNVSIYNDLAGIPRVIKMLNLGK